MHIVNPINTLNVSKQLSRMVASTVLLCDLCRLKWVNMAKRKKAVKEEGIIAMYSFV